MRVLFNFTLMWLFDDILKKPQDTTPADPLGQGIGGSTGDDSSSTGSGGNPPTDDTVLTQKPEFLIQKSETKSLFDTEEKNEAIILTPDSPLEVPEIHAEVGGASVLGADSPSETPVTDSPLFIQNEEEIVSPEASSTSILGFSDTDTTRSPTDSLFGNSSPVTEEKTESKTLSFLHPKEFIEKSINDIDTMITDLDNAHASKITEAEGYGAEKDKFATLETDTYAAATKLDEEKAQALHVRELLEKELSTAETDEAALEALMPKEASPTLAEENTPVTAESATPSPAWEPTPVSESPVVGSVETTLTGLAVQNTVTETMDTKSETTPTLIVSESPKTEETTPVVPLI